MQDGEKYQVGNRFIVEASGKNCLVTVKSGVIFLSKCWGFRKNNIINSTKKNVVPQLNSLIESAEKWIEVFKNEENRRKSLRTIGISNYSLSKSENLEDSHQLTDHIIIPGSHSQSHLPKDKISNEIELLEKKLQVFHTQIEQNKVKIAFLENSIHIPIYYKAFYPLVLIAIVYLLFFK